MLDQTSLNVLPANHDDPLAQLPRVPPARLMSLDVFRGAVIFIMLLVNNLGDYTTTGFFWKHADWVKGSQAQAYREWWISLKSSEEPLATAFCQFPLWRHCTLADYVMPSFMFIIGVAIPFSKAAAAAKGVSPFQASLRVLKRVAMLIILGWMLSYFRDQFAASLHGKKPWAVSLGMDVLQLLGCAYLVARLLCLLPGLPRIIAATLLLLWHYSLLRFYPQGSVAAGTFTEGHEAIGYIYRTWPIWNQLTVSLGPVSIGWRGLLSVPPAAATMLLGSLVGNHLLRSDLDDRTKVNQLAVAGSISAVLGFLWAFDLPFNKPRWSPSYLLYVTGVATLVLSALYTLIDVQHIRRWAYPLLVFGSNSIAAYFFPILSKVLLLNTPRIRLDNAVTLHAVKFATLGLISWLLYIVAVKLVSGLRDSIGPSAYSIGGVLLMTLIVLWSRFLGPTIGPLITSTTNVNNAILSILKAHLGPHEGGWLFTFAFLTFWWLLFEQLYRRQIFWKL